jgi:hypothetical protein
MQDVGHTSKLAKRIHEIRHRSTPRPSHLDKGLSSSLIAILYCPKAKALLVCVTTD